MKSFCTIFLVLLSSLLVNADNYANFFDGENCDGEQGIGVKILDQGCLWEPNRQSVYIPRTWNPSLDMCLVMTDGPEDNKYICQKNHINFTPTGMCLNLRSMGNYTSYRFLEEKCGKNNC